MNVLERCTLGVNQYRLTSLHFHNFECKCKFVPHLYVIDSQLGSDLLIFNLGYNLVILGD